MASMPMSLVLHVFLFPQRSSWLLSKQLIFAFYLVCGFWSISQRLPPAKSQLFFYR